jgi:hypothetical protein
MIKRGFLLVLSLVSIGMIDKIKAEGTTAGAIFLEHTQQVYSLTGQWRFSRIDKPEFALPNYDDSAWEWISVPGHWNMLGIKHTEVAWYRLKFRISPAFEVVPIAIRVPAILDSHELYVNGTIIGGAGTIGSDGTIIKKSSQLGVYPIPKDLVAKKGWNLIALRVGDNIGWGGLETPDFFIGRAEILDLEFKKFVVWNCSVFIILAFLGLYFLALYLGHSREKSYLYFSLLTLTVSLMLFGYFSFPYWVIDNFWFTHFVFNAGVHLAIIFGFYFTYAFYDYPPDILIKLVTIGCCLLFLVLLLTPVHHAILRFYGNISLTIALSFDAVGFIYLFFLSVKSIVFKKQGAKTVGVGSLILMSCFLNDILLYLRIVDNKRFGNEGTVVFMVCISFAMFLKYSKIDYESGPATDADITCQHLPKK